MIVISRIQCVMLVELWHDGRAGLMGNECADIKAYIKVVEAPPRLPIVL